MKDYLIYDPETNIGVMTARCHPKEMLEYDPAEEPYIEIDFEITVPDDWEIVDGIAQERVKPITSEMVNVERDKRIAAGVSFDGHLFDFDSASKENITGAGSLAGMAVLSGAVVGDYGWNGGVDFAWLDSSNVAVKMDAQTMFQFSQVAAGHVRDHIFAARTLKDMAIIPQDYKDDSYWP
ncbi:DUF4376 domain-containing protein [Neptunicoccus sediminis]|uniref:DUF4376 domain-containing protein n=1 Tax=Neptunicoccus sediminis TaxID=1892596 RepID=UPI000845DA98|nr:DUF4376 domain-containing protein [Neptunicoccus sediminis]